MTNIDVSLIRKRMRLSQEELGRIIGVSRNTIANYEKGGVIPESKRELLTKLMHRDAASEKILDVIVSTGKGDNSNTESTNGKMEFLKRKIKELEDINKQTLATFKSTSIMEDEFEKLFSGREITRLESENKCLIEENKRLIEEIGRLKNTIETLEAVNKKRNYNNELPVSSAAEKGVEYGK